MNEKNNILVSIITVSLNSEETIEKTITSVINQTYKNIEYIIIDGGSTDGTLDVIHKYKERIKYIVSEKDNGLYNAMNKGIALSSGALIGIINSDDWYEDHTVETVVNSYLGTGLIKDNTIYYGFLRLWKKNKKLNEWKEFCVRRRHHDFIPEYVINHPTWFVPKKLYNQYGGFDETFKYSSDYDLMNKFYHKSVNFHPIDSILANFRDGGISSRFVAEIAHERELIQIRYNYLNQNEINKNTEEVYTLRKNNIFSLGKRLFRKIKKSL